MAEVYTRRAMPCGICEPTQRGVVREDRIMALFPAEYRRAGRQKILGEYRRASGARPVMSVKEIWETLREPCLSVAGEVLAACRTCWPPFGVRAGGMCVAYTYSSS